MSTWVCAPSKRQEAEVRQWAAIWKQQGYKVSIFRDAGEEITGGDIDICISGPYEGHSIASNKAIAAALEADPTCDWVASVGDDVQCDMNHSADEIAQQCSGHFAGTFGVMQPTGDRFANGSIDRIAGSPWFGRSYCERINQGRGPWWPEYFHMYNDEEAQCVAQVLGVFWQRRDLIHLHRHFMRETDAIESKAVAKPVPEFLKYANSQENWNRMQRIFFARRAALFPGHEPLGAHELMGSR